MQTTTSLANQKKIVFLLNVLSPVRNSWDARDQEFCCHRRGGLLPEFPEVSGIAHVIQLAIAPVFLLTGIGAILAVMTSRLGRIIDRARVLEAMLNAASPEMLAVLRNDLGTLSRRAKLISFAITLCTTTALLICTVIAILFLSAFLHFDASIPVALLFVAAMLAFFLGLLWFLPRSTLRRSTCVSDLGELKRSNLEEVKRFKASKALKSFEPCVAARHSARLTALRPLIRQAIF